VTSLALKSLFGIAFLAVAMALLLFVPAGTLHYWQAWLYLAIFFVITGLITLYLMRKDPDLLRRRLRGGPTAEGESSQRLIMLLASAGFIGLLVVSALDHRFHWSSVPLFLVLAGELLTAIGFYVTFLVYRENTFAAATIEVETGQHVISTGPYAVVRHPMYAGGLIYLLAMPLALGSFWGLLVFVPLVPVLVWRLLDEEQFLGRNLPGYLEYRSRVRWRLLPGVF
jgi:protein-S-isoprenylcysteine O-methyltransferase Ste14